MSGIYDSMASKLRRGTIRQMQLLQDLDDLAVAIGLDPTSDKPMLTNPTYRYDGSKGSDLGQQGQSIPDELNVGQMPASSVNSTLTDPMPRVQDINPSSGTSKDNHNERDESVPSGIDLDSAHDESIRSPVTAMSLQSKVHQLKALITLLLRKAKKALIWPLRIFLKKKNRHLLKNLNEEEALAYLYKYIQENAPGLNRLMVDIKIWLYQAGLTDFGSNWPTGWQEALLDAIATEATITGNDEIQFVLGDMYWKGQGTQVDFIKAAEWFQLAANQGHADAQHQLGRMYNNGLGMFEKHDGMAFEWYKRAARQGHIESQYNLGLFYYYGLGVAKDFDKGVKWFRLAANQGHVESQLFMGRISVRENTMAWYNNTTQQGDVYAQGKLDEKCGAENATPPEHNS